MDTIVIWSDRHKAVLGHVVARELSARPIYAHSDQGFLCSTAQPATCTRIAVIDYGWLRPRAAAVAERHFSVVAI
ncbi:MAG: hypothetical protein U5N21_17525 [Rhodococcus sp. (in: high G+C Gram-positive bacteria)]|nr:hypothetical protein [Rhodococcus sp. (in: high G+C Gram-positive bacteria)]